MAVTSSQRHLRLMPMLDCYISGLLSGLDLLESKRIGKNVFRNLNLHSDEWDTLKLHVNKCLGAYVSTHHFGLSFQINVVCTSNMSAWFEDMALEWVWINILQWIFKTPLLSTSELLKCFSIESVTCYFVGFNNTPINIHTTYCITSSSFEGK